MDAQLKTILLTFFLDFCIFLIYLTIFFCIRSKRDRKEPLINWHPQENTLRQDFDHADLKPSLVNNLQQDKQL